MHRRLCRVTQISLWSASGARPRLGPLPLMLAALAAALLGISCDKPNTAEPSSPSISSPASADPDSASTDPPPPSSPDMPTTASARQTESDLQRLHGAWVAHDVDTKLGDVKIKLVFHDEGPVKILAWSDLPLVGQVRNKSAPYAVHDHTISSEALRGGTSVKYWFDDQGHLIIQYNDGKTVQFSPAQQGEE